jgi:DNA-binding IclR family transcriptional regulator
MRRHDDSSLRHSRPLVSGTVSKALVLLELVARGHRKLGDLTVAAGMPKDIVNRWGRTLVQARCLSDEQPGERPTEFG